ncbi:MAG: ribosome rescue protein RqcH [Candidatus Methanofastidiosia archaeon]
MISSFDTHIIIDELIADYEITGMKVDKIYKIGDEIRIKLYGRGRRDLVLKPGVALFNTSYPKTAPQHPSGFAMQLRKYLCGLRILNIEQIGFDRIVKITFGLYGEETLIKYYVIVELFGNGNLILTDDELTIIGVLSSKVWATRSLKAKEQYKTPPTMLSPYDVDVSKLIDGETQIVKLLATKLNMGGMYAEEICLLAGIDKKDVNPDQEKLQKGIDALLSLPKSPAIVGENIVPFDLLMHNGKERTPFNTLNEAADALYGKKELEKIATKEVSKKQKHLSKLERILSTQKRTVETYEAKQEIAQKKGDSIFENYQLVDTLLSTIYSAVKKLGWHEVKKKVESNEKLRNAMQRIDDKKGIICVQLGDMEVELDITKNINDNAQTYYAISKKMKHKINGAKKAIAITLSKIENTSVDEVETKTVKKRVRKKKEWYERYHWTISSDDYLIVGGRDAATNETLVKKHLDEDDIHMHADLTGASQVIIKKGKDAPESTLIEAGIFAVSFSKAWKMSISSLDAYWVYPEQVTKEPPSGEFLGKGAFFIKGKKNFLKNLPVEVGIGVYKNKMMCGPLSAAISKCEKPIKIVPGRRSKEEIAKSIKTMLEWDDVNDIIRALPPGTCDIGK